MKKVRISFIALKSVVIAVNDNDDEESYEETAINMAEKWINKNQPYTLWELDERDEPEDAEGEDAINEEQIKTCPHCNQQYVDDKNYAECPYCGEEVL